MRYASTRLALVAAVGMSALWVGRASANSVTFVGTNASPALSASATFSVDTSTTGGPFLKIVLSNTATVGATDPTQLLTVLDFQSSSALSLANGNGSPGHPLSYAVAKGIDGMASTFASGPFAGAIDAGSQWGLQNVSGGTSWAVGSTGIGGMGLGTADLFENGTTMQGLGSPTGGILPPIGIGSGGGSSLTKTPYFMDTITFYIYGISAGYDPSKCISNVSFLYGTASNDSHFNGTPPTVPLPAAVWSGMALLAGLGVVAKLRRKSLLS